LCWSVQIAATPGLVTAFKTPFAHFGSSALKTKHDHGGMLASGLSGGLYRAKIFDRFAFFTCNKLQFKRSSWTQRHPYGEAFLLSCTLA